MFNSLSQELTCHGWWPSSHMGWKKMCWKNLLSIKSSVSNKADIMLKFSNQFSNIVYEEIDEASKINEAVIKETDIIIMKHTNF